MRYRGSNSRRRLQSAAVMRHKKSLLTRESSTGGPQLAASFFQKFNGFITKINDNQEAMPDGIINYPIGEKFYNMNRFRPVSNQRLSRLGKMKK